MKRFTFPLDRVLDFRRLETQAAEAVFERLRAERAAILARDAQLVEESRRLNLAASAGMEVAASLLEAASRYREVLATERRNLAARLARQDQEVDRQRRLVMEARQREQALEKLKARRKLEWDGLAARELDELAADAHRAKAHSLGVQRRSSGVEKR
jgi:flagellar export protein FliJ